MNLKYTPEKIEWLRDNIQGCHFKELTEKFNEQFGADLKVSTMISLTARHGLHNGIDCRLNKGYEPTQFKKGIVPWNKGKKGAGGWKLTQFQKGHVPSNYKLVGSERNNVDGYVEIKIADPNKWRLKHQVVWESLNGNIPKGFAVIFGDGNTSNLDPNNLILVSRKQLLILNRKNLIQGNAELTRTAVIITNVYDKIHERSRKKGGHDD